MRSIRFFAFVSGVALLIGAGTTPAAALGPAPSAAGLILRAAAITRPAAELFGADPRFGLIGDGVNTGTGNLVLTGTDLIAGSLSWSRTYNSLSDRTGPQGTGWTTAYSAGLAVQAGGNVVLTDDDGRSYTYVAAAGGFTRPLDLDDQLRSVPGGFVLDRGSENWTFTSGGRLTTIDRDGERLTLSYDGAGRLTGVVSSAGQQLTIGYTGDRISSVTSGDGRVARYEYTGSALATVIGADTTRTTYTSSGGRVTSVTDPNGTTAQTYDGGGRVASQTLGAQTPLVLAYSDAGTKVSQGISALTFVHDADGHLTSVIDPLGKSVAQTYDSRGHLKTITRRGGGTTTLTYDDQGNAIRRDESGDVWAYAFDAARRITQQTAPGAAVTTYDYTGTSRLPSLIVDPEGGRTTQTLAGGLVTGRTDPDGATESFAYNAARQLISIIDGTGAETKFAYNPAGDLIRQESPLGLVTSWVYDAAGRLKQRTGSDGGTDIYAYDGQGRVSSSTDPENGTTAYTYTGDSKVASITDPTGGITSYGYDGQGNLATVSVTGAGTSTYAYDDQGRASSLTAPDGSVTRYTYDADGNRTESAGARGSQVTAYDSRGRVIRTKDELGRETSYAYDSAGHLTTVTDPAGAIWRTAYDKAGRVTSTTDPTGAIARQEWTKAGDLAAKVDPLGRRTTFTYDKAHHRLTQTDPAGGVTRYTYDKQGRLLTRTTAAGLVTKNTYGTTSQPATVTDPSGGVTTYRYDRRGDTTQIVHPGGGIEKFTFDAAGRMLTAQDENARTTSYRWTKGGQLAATTDARGGVTAYTYNAAGQQTSSTDPLGRVTKQAYNSDGSLTAVTDSAGGIVRTEYDKAEQLIARVGADGTRIGYTYDLAGRRASMTDGTGTTRFRYDAAGRLLSKTRPDGAVLTTGWDQASQLTSLTYPDGRKIGYGYDPNGQLSSVIDTAGGNASYTRDADGRVTAEKLPRAWARTYGYTGGRLTAYTEQQGLLTPQRTALTRNADGLVSRRTEGTGLLAKTCDYAYDPAGQLTSASGSACQRIAAAYDAAGNRTSLTRGAIISTQRYDSANQLTSTDLALRTGASAAEIAQVPASLATALAGGSLLTTTFRYDQSGRQTGSTNSLERTSIRYDGFGRPATSSEAVGLKARQTTMTYDGNGLLDSASNRFGVLGLTDPPETALWGTPDTTKYLWTSTGSVPQLLAQRKVPLIGTPTESLFAGDGQLLGNDADFVYGNGRLSAQRGPVAASFSQDVFGSAVQTLDTKLWVQALDYDSLGLAGGVAGLDPAGGLIATQQFGYRGELGVAGDLYLRARSYDPSTGQFTTVDPVSQQIGATAPDSPYVYANNDPNDYVDPRGEFAFGAWLGGLGLLALGGDDYRCKTGDPDSITRHQKSFPNDFGGTTILCTRGYIVNEGCLKAETGCLSTLWFTGQRERAAQSVTIKALNDKRISRWDRIRRNFGFGPVVGRDIDWELGESMLFGPAAFRSDISTGAPPLNIYEVKEWKGDATVGNVEAQLGGYIATLNIDYAVLATRGRELMDWATTFTVYDGFWDFFGDQVFVWGSPTSAGHVYFAEGDKVNADIKTKAKRQQEKENGLCQVLCIPLVPIPVPVPV